MLWLLWLMTIKYRLSYFWYQVPGMTTRFWFPVRATLYWGDKRMPCISWTILSITSIFSKSPRLVQGYNTFSFNHPLLRIQRIVLFMPNVFHIQSFFYTLVSMTKERHTVTWIRILEGHFERKERAKSLTACMLSPASVGQDEVIKDSPEAIM